MDNETKYDLNDDIEDLLSENYEKSPPITKVIGNRVNNGEFNAIKKINDRMEISSNKDVDIGLDLLVNKDKRNTPDEVKKKMFVSNIDGATRLDRPRSGAPVVNLMGDLDLDKSSVLNQHDIDELIDNADSENKPTLVSQNDFDKLSHIDDSGAKSVIESFHSQLNVRDRFKDPPLRPSEIKGKKQEIIFKLEKMRRLGINGIKKFNMSNNLDDMETELARVKYEREVESSIKFQRKCMMAFVTGSELINNKFDFLDFKLDGWSEQVHDNINDYNEVFEELHEKYSTKMKMAPEIKLLFMLGGSAFMYHLTNSMFKNSIPGMEDIIKQNPDLMKQFASAAINQMQGEEKQAAEIFNNFSNTNSAPRASTFNQPTRNVPVAQHTGYVESRRPMPTPPKVQNKITPPSGVDDILNELKSNTFGTNSDSSISEILSSRTKRRKNVQRKSVVLS
tara:strand:- start:8166 stop:9515 length:1350 start_codon:yes stop_codon:yes gene_type:complete